MKYEGRELIGFFKGRAGDYNKLSATFAASLIAAAARTRNHVSPYYRVHPKKKK